MGVPTVDDVARITVMADPRSRNLHITQCYHQLARAIRDAGPGANWCTFATWASRQAGRTIRGEDHVEALAYRLRVAPELAEVLVDAVQSLGKRLRKAGVKHASPATASSTGASPQSPSLHQRILDALDPQGIVASTSDAVARGNLKVFAEIGREFARFVAQFPAAASASRTADLEQFVAELRTGEPPDGQQLLRDAFHAYAAARTETDVKARAELMLYANLLVGLHEQTRLQPEIAAALDAAFAHLHAAKDDVLAVLLPGSWLRLRHRAARLLAGLVGHRLLVDRIVERIVDTARRQVRQVITQAFMTLQVHDEVLPLAADLRAAFAPSLQHVIRPDLRALLARIDPSADSMVGSGAQDWADLADRMHFIADFFRAYHEHQDLFAAPFTKEQVDALIAGRWPAGRL